MNFLSFAVGFVLGIGIIGIWFIFLCAWSYRKSEENEESSKTSRNTYSRIYEKHVLTDELRAIAVKLYYEYDMGIDDIANALDVYSVSVARLFPAEKEINIDNEEKPNGNS